MLTVHSSLEVEAPAETVWPIIENFGDISWAPGIERVEIVGEGIGMARMIYMPGMEAIEERLTAMEPDIMRVSYAIPRGLPMPLTDYTASGQVTALPGGRCRLDWRGEAELGEGVTEQEAKDILSGTYDMLMGWIAEHALK
jgi:hypothetical protein